MILVTGSAGHLGEALMRTLRERDAPVRGLDVQASDYTDVVGSIVDAQVCRDAMQDVTHVLHTASLHKPHVATHSRQDFVDVNISGTLNLLEAAVQQGESTGKYPVFVMTSTTSAFGEALTAEGHATWIAEETPHRCKNIYGVTKVAAEDSCQLFARNHLMRCTVLRVSRFFPEDDDSATVRSFCDHVNAKINELLYRRADIYDMVTTHLAAMEYKSESRFDRFIISGNSPFVEADREQLWSDAPQVVASYYDRMPSIYGTLGYRMFDSIDRVYRTDKARRLLGWEPVYTFERALQCL